MRKSDVREIDELQLELTKDCCYALVYRWCDAKIAGVPTRLINFITRTVIGEIWGKLLQVADDVKAGKRPNHKEAIEKQPDLYQFIQERIAIMFKRLEAEQETSEGRLFISYLQS